MRGGHLSPSLRCHGVRGRCTPRPAPRSSLKGLLIRIQPFASSLFVRTGARPCNAGEARVAERTGASRREVTVTVFDDDAASEGQQERERETLVLLVRDTEEGILLVGASREDVDEALAALRNQLVIGRDLLK